MTYKFLQKLLKEEIKSTLQNSYENNCIQVYLQPQWSEVFNLNDE